MESQAEIQQAYQNYVLEMCKKPLRFEEFSSYLEAQEISLDDQYKSLTALERDILLSTFTETIERLESADEYRAFTTREKILACYFTWFEELGEMRDFLKILTKNNLLSITTERYLKTVEPLFKMYIQDLLNEGTDTGEIADRSLIESRYPALLWYNTRFLFHFWLNDESEAYERTDAAVEKAVNFSLDLLAPNLLDSGFDLIRFLVGK